MLLTYLYAAWVLRDRIKDTKIAEMDQITLALRGDKETVKTIVIRGLGTPTATADLLTHQMFLESRWEWPHCLLCAEDSPAWSPTATRFVIGRDD